MVWIKAILALETLIWYGFLLYIHLEDNKRVAKRELVAYWKDHFKNNVASQWTFWDGLGS